VNDGGPDHEGFLRDLRDSHAGSVAVVERLKRNGIPAFTKQPEEAKTPWEKARFANERDVIVAGEIILEVKSRKLRFTENPIWFPFPTANLCTVPRWERRTEKPLAFVLHSRETGDMLVCSSATEPVWEKHHAPDTRRGGRMDWVYRIQVTELRPFDALVAYLRQIIDPALLTDPIDTPRAAAQELKDSPPYCKAHSSHFCPCCKPHLYDPLDAKDQEYVRGWEKVAPIVPIGGA
jgi:hypothetical protein